MLTVPDLVEQWIEDRQPVAKTASEFRGIAERFAKFVGIPPPVSAVTKAHVRDFKAQLQKASSRQGE